MSKFIGWMKTIFYFHQKKTLKHKHNVYIDTPRSYADVVKKDSKRVRVRGSCIIG